MNKKIGILRGINVGGKRKIKMDDLKSMYKKMGLKDIKTYIQSGNLIFNSDKSHSELETSLEKAITENFGFDVPVIIRTEEELENIMNKNPFFEENVDIKQLYLTFLKTKPSTENIENIRSFDYSPDKFSIEDKNVFVFCAGKYYGSKLTNNFFEKQLKVSATTRNWKTVLKLIEMGKSVTKQ